MQFLMGERGGQLGLARTVAIGLLVALLAAACSRGDDSAAVPGPVIIQRPGIEGPQVEELQIDTSPPELLVAPTPTAPPAPSASADPAAGPDHDAAAGPDDEAVGHSDAGFTLTIDDSALPTPAAPASGETSTSAEPDAAATGADDTSVVGTDLAETPPAENVSDAAVPLDASADNAPETVPATPLDAASPAATSVADRVSLYPDPSAGLSVAAGGGPAESEGATVRGVTPTTITVGSIVTQTLVGRPHNLGVCEGAQARFAQANARNELSREILFQECWDDAAQGPLSSGLARALVDEGVFAVAPVSSPAFVAQSIFNEAHVPYVGSGDLPGFCGQASSYGFGVLGAAGCPVLPARSHLVVSTPVLTSWLNQFGEQFRSDADAKLVLALEDSVRGIDVRSARVYEAELLGLPITPALVVPPVSAEQMNARSVALKILAEVPTVVMIDAANGLELVPELRWQGFDGQIVWVGTIDPLGLFTADRRAELAGTIVITAGLDLAATESAAWAELEAAAAAIGYEGPTVPEEEQNLDLAAAEELVAQAEERARQRAAEAGEPFPADGAAVDAGVVDQGTVGAPSSEGVLGAGFVEGYLAADFLVAALAATPEPLTAEALHNLVNGGWWYPGFGDVACGGWWPASRLVEVPCVSISQVDLFGPQLIQVAGLGEIEPRWLDILGEN